MIIRFNKSFVYTHTFYQKSTNVSFIAIARSGKSFIATEATPIYSFRNRNVNNLQKAKNFEKNKNVFDSIQKTKQNVYNRYPSFNNLENLIKDYKSKSLKKVTLRTATTRLTCFANRGNHIRRNSLFRKYRVQRVFTSKNTKKLPLSFYLPAFFHAATPFVRLKTRRRRGSRRNKKVIQKVTFRLRSTGERKSYLLFSKRLQKSNKKTKNGTFIDQVQTQREALFAKNRQTNQKRNKQNVGINKAVDSTSTSSSNNLWEIRDEIHKRAFKIKPRIWRRFKRLKIVRERQLRFEQERQKRYAERFLRYYNIQAIQNLFLIWIKV